MLSERKKEIIMATLNLAYRKGLQNVSMSMIAQEIGIKKPSLYNHFSSKEELIEEMYNFLRLEAKNSLNDTALDYKKIFSNKEPQNILLLVVNNYINLNQEDNIKKFYKIIYSERCYNKMATRIINEETLKMIEATKFVFKSMEKQELCLFDNLDMCATSFAFTIHGLIDFLFDQENLDDGDIKKAQELIANYINWFCATNMKRSEKNEKEIN